MRRFRSAFSAAAIVLAITGMSLSSAATAASRAPLGYQLLCLKSPQECKGGGAASVEASEDVLRTLKRVNAHVNRAITPRNDRGADVWTASASSGDCEDYVLAKRRALMKAGFSPSALRIAYVKTRGGEGHAILVVKTNRGDLVLDNLNGAVRPLGQSGYRIVSMSGANPMNWS